MEWGCELKDSCRFVAGAATNYYRHSAGGVGNEIRGRHGHNY